MLGKGLPAKKEKVENLIRFTKKENTQKNKKKVIHITHTEALKGYEAVSTLINEIFANIE